MAGSCAVRFELVVGAVFVAFKIGNPLFGEVLGDPPVVCGSPAYHMVDDAACPYAVLFIACHIGSGKERLYGVHICV